MKVIVDLRVAFYSWLMWVIGVAIMKWLTASTNWQEILMWCLVGGLPVVFIVMTGDIVRERRG